MLRGEEDPLEGSVWPVRRPRGAYSENHSDLGQWRGRGGRRQAGGVSTNRSGRPSGESEGEKRPLAMQDGWKGEQ